MSSLVKYLLIVAVLGALAVAYAAYVEVDHRHQVEKNLADTQDILTSTKSTLAKTKSELNETQSAKEKVEGDLAASKKNADDLQTQLSQAQKKADDLNQAVTEQKAKVQEATAALEDIKTKLDGKTPEDYKNAVLKAQQDLTASQSELRILQDAFQSKQAELKQWADAFSRINTGTMPPVAGKVTFVNRTWNFVVLNIGVSQGVVPNGQLVVYRGKQLLAHLKVTSAEASSCVADILPEAKGDIQVNDDVLN